MQNKQPSRSRSRGAIVWGLILIVVGFMWMLNNLGYLPGDFWRTLLRFWPVLLILIGLEIALRGFPNWVAVPVLLLAVVAIAAGLLVLAPTLPGEDLVGDTFRQERGSIDSARVELEMDKADVIVEGLASPSDLLAEGRFDHSSSIAIQKEYEEVSGLGTLRVSDRYEAFFPFFFLEDTRNDWELRLSPDLALDLDLDGDDTQLNLSLEGLEVGTLSFQLDDCTGELGLPGTDGLNARLTLSDSDLRVTVPAAAGARVTLELDDAQLTIDSTRFTEVGDGEYLSRDYEQAEAKVDLVIEASDSSITIG
jgi:hypothetical protein